MKKQFIIETQSNRFTFYTIIEADDIQEAIDIKATSGSVKGGHVTGATRAVNPNHPHWGEVMKDVKPTPPPKPVPPPPKPVPPPPKYILTERHA